MVDNTMKDGKASTKVSSNSESGVRKFTLSCSRCRASKLKCDKKEPCMECLKRNVGHLCIKDERQPRAKRAKTNHENGNTKTKASQNHNIEAEEAAQVLEHFVDGRSRTNAYPLADLEPTLSTIAPDYPNRYWSTIDHSQRDCEKLTLIREIIDAMPELAMIHCLHEVFVTRCQGPLGNVTHTPTFMKQAEKFCDCLSLASSEAQAIAMSDSICMDTLACHLLVLVLALAFHPTPSLLGWSPTPLALRVEELRASASHSKTWRSLALRCLQGGLSLFCGSIAGLQAAVMLLLDGQEGSLALDAVLVTAISGAQRLSLHRLGDAPLEVSASPVSAYEDGYPTSMEPPHIRTEIGVRIWWALVLRDWSRGQALGYYSIQPSHFNTRMPLHINDDDLCSATLKVDAHDHITERPRSEFTILSYTVHALEVAIFARESIDLRGPLRQAEGQAETNAGGKMRNHLNRKYEDFVARLPSYFRLGSTVGLTSTGSMAAIPVQRWMLHQQLWSLFLRLHRADLASQDGRASCLLLAQNIISIQAQIKARCAVCGSLSTSETQLTRAAMVLLVDLLFSPKHNDPDRSSAQLHRLMTRDKIREAIELLRTPSDTEGVPPSQDAQAEGDKASAQRSVVALEALMKLEEEEAGNNEKFSGLNSTDNLIGGQESRSDRTATKLLKNRVVNILEALQEDARNAAATIDPASLNAFPALDMSRPLPTVPDEFQDLDVLPVLSNDSSYDFWQFLDFTPPTQSPTENNSFSATVNSQNAIGSTPFMTSSGVEQSLSGLGTPEFTDMYSNTDGFLVTHTSPSSIESGPTRLSGGNEAATTISSPYEYIGTKLF